MTSTLEATKVTETELNADDFTVKGERDGSFRYPFRLKHDRDSIVGMGRPKLGSPFGFELASRAEGKVFVRPGFDMQEVVSRSTGAVVEVAGPTDSGYETLEGIDLPRKPVMMNVASAMQHESRGLTPLDRLMIDVMADGRELPLRDESVGLLIVSCLPRLDQSHHSFHASDEEFEAEVQWIFASAAEKAKLGHDSSSEIEASPRIGLWHEADRVVEDGGLFVVKGVSEEDIRLAAALGFEIVAHTPVYKQERGLHIPHEMVFRRAQGEVEHYELDLSTLKRRRFGSSVMKKLGLRT